MKGYWVFVIFVFSEAHQARASYPCKLAPESLTPKPKTLNPNLKPQTLNPKP